MIWLFRGTKASRFTLVSFLTLLLLFGSCVLGNCIPPCPGSRAESLGVFPESSIAERDALHKRGINVPSEVSLVSVQGEVNLLVVCVDFSDKLSRVSVAQFDTLFFGEVGPSVSDYYQEVSRNKVVLTVVSLPSFIGWRRAPFTYANYVAGQFGFGIYPHNSQKLAEDIFDILDPYVDFSVYDNDKNGTIDGLVIVHAGSGAEVTGDTNDIWSHKWSVRTSVRKDGVWTGPFCFLPEYWRQPGDMTIGVGVHELGHLLFGFPDLYDGDGSSQGLGNWCVMAGGSWNGITGSCPSWPCANLRTTKGWTQYVVVQDPRIGEIISPAEEGGVAYYLWTDGLVNNYVYLIENRQRIGYDSLIPGDGLLIWRIDQTQYSNNHEWYPGHEIYGNSEIQLIQADDRWELEKNRNRGDLFDPYPWRYHGQVVNTEFTHVSSPSSDWYDHSETYVSVTGIEIVGQNIICNMRVSRTTDVNDDSGTSAIDSVVLEAYPNPFSDVLFLKVHLQRESEILIYNILGEQVKRFSVSACKIGQVWWDGVDSDGNRCGSGVYVVVLQSAGVRICKKVVRLR